MLRLHFPAIPCQTLSPPFSRKQGLRAQPLGERFFSKKQSQIRAPLATVKALPEGEHSERNHFRRSYKTPMPAPKP